jgi:DNA modification methylase
MLHARPLVALPDGRVVAGNMRLRALQAFVEDGDPVMAEHFPGYRVPVVYRDLDDAAAAEVALRDNNTFGEWDDDELAEMLYELREAGGELELTGFTDDALHELLASVAGAQPEPACDPDDAPPLPADPQSKRGEVYELGRHRLMCGDSTDPADVATLMAGEHAPLLFTSPPYIDAREYRGEKDLTVQHVASFLLAYADVADLLAVNLGLLWRDGELVPYWDHYTYMAHQAGLKLLAWNVWNRDEAGTIAQATRMFPTFHEFVLVYGEAERKLNRTVPNKNAGKAAGLYVAQADGSRRTTSGPAKVRSHKPLPSVFTTPPDKSRGTAAQHPARFPVAFPTAYIEACTNEGDAVVDPFGGSGSTLVAAELTGRRAFLMEMDEGYCDVIRQRYAEVTA